MKTLIIFIMLTVIFQVNTLAQQTDDNTLAINNYFQNINVKSTVNKPTLLNADVFSYVGLIQTGNENSIYINALQTGDNQSIRQIGDKNNYEYYNYYSNEKSQLKVNQEGTLNSLQIFGENAIMKNAIINQKSSFKSVVIKNYTN